MEGGAEGVIKVRMLAGACQGVGGGRVEASGAGGEPEGVSGDTRPREVVDMVVGSS